MTHLLTNTNKLSNQFNQLDFEDWVEEHNYHLIQLFNCFKYNFKDILPHSDKEWKNEEEDIFNVFCQFIYEYS